MKKNIILFFILISFSSYSQSSLKGSRERSRKKWFSHGQKPRRQMSHFDKSKKDLLLKDNGTSYRRNRKSKYIVDGNGYVIPNQGKIKK